MPRVVTDKRVDSARWSLVPLGRWILLLVWRFLCACGGISMKEDDPNRSPDRILDPVGEPEGMARATVAVRDPTEDSVDEISGLQFRF